MHNSFIFNNMYVTLRSSTCFEQLTEGDDTRGCGDTIGLPEDEQRAARNMLRSVV